MFVLSIRADVDPGSGPLLPRARCGLLGEARRGNGAQGREPLWFGRGRCRPIGALSRTGDLIFARPDRLNTLTARELPCHLASVMTWTAHLASCCVRYTICVAPEFRSASRLEPRVDAAPRRPEECLRLRHRRIRQITRRCQGQEYPGPCYCPGRHVNTLPAVSGGRDAAPPLQTVEAPRRDFSPPVTATTAFTARWLTRHSRMRSPAGGGGQVNV